MTTEPSEDDITVITSVTGADRETAIRYLKVKENNVERALNAILDGEDITSAEQASSWDDSAWSTERDGAPTQGPQNFAYNDGNLRPLGHSAAPTRGSSPVPSLKHPSTKAEEDAEMEWALANSRQDLRYGSQETGVIGSDGKTTSSHFGPATKSTYDPSQWAMTVSAPAEAYETSEVIPDVEPSDRQQVGENPRFIKYHPSGDYLSSLLTIAHSVPLARETLLMRSYAPTTYGHDPEWWRGHTIKLPRIVHAADGAPAEAASTEHGEMITEVQRVMALLDCSKRLYGSADSLSRLAAASKRGGQTSSETLTDQLLRSWEIAAKSISTASETDTELFHSVIGTNSAQGVSTPDMWVLPLNVTIEDEAEGATVTLAEVMDKTLWDTDPDDEAFCDTYMERCADLLPMRVSQSNATRTNLGVIIPASFHVDKYLKQNVEATRVVRKDMAQAKKRMSKIDEICAKIKTFTSPLQKEPMDASALVGYALRHFNGENRRMVMEERESRGLDVSQDVPIVPESHASIAAKLENVCNSVTEKLNVLEQEKERARQALAQLSQDTPPELEGGSLKYRYTLRGVATKPNVTYILRPRADVTELAADEMFPDSDAPPGMRWWRIEYDVNMVNGKILETESSEDDVLRAVELEHTQALLVYASDRAVNHPQNEELSEELKAFIQLDDESFSHELEQSTHRTVAYTPPEDQPRLSIESTNVNFGDERDGDPPPYSSPNPAFNFDDAKVSLLEGRRFGDEHSPPAHEIKLDDVDVDEGVEMVERSNGPLLSRNAFGSRIPDIEMREVGDSDHVEDAGANNTVP